MATTYNFTNGSIAGIDKPIEATLEDNFPTIRRAIVDFSKQTIDAGEGDIAQVINIPAATYVIAVWARIITAETTNGTVDLGYGGSNQWGDALAIDAAAGSIVGGSNDWLPVYFASADTIDIKATTDTADVDIDGAKLEVCAVMLPAKDAF